MQAEVGNVQGIWQEIMLVPLRPSLLSPRHFCSLSVNTMAGNLTIQVRGFAQISAAAMDGDPTRFITVEASGEMDSLKTQINQMVFNLREEEESCERGGGVDKRSKSEFLVNMSHEIRCVSSCFTCDFSVFDEGTFQDANEWYHRNDRVDAGWRS